MNTILLRRFCEYWWVWPNVIVPAFHRFAWIRGRVEWGWLGVLTAFGCALSFRKLFAYGYMLGVENGTIEDWDNLGRTPMNYAMAYYVIYPLTGLLAVKVFLVDTYREVVHGTLVRRSPFYTILYTTTTITLV